MLAFLYSLQKSCILLNFYSLNITMTKKQRLYLGTTIIVCTLAITLWVLANNTPQPQQDKSIWALMNEMDWLRDLKQECADNLGIKDSAKFLKWYSWYCDSRDTQIKELRSQINELGKKDYEGLM